ncbi:MULTISPECIES: PDR/VanB family oxidoreductase [unclassified Aureimonas]|uniref:PDR/VanB family oxidoreductase n=1 Tax=unclassified Aureimonas TaxID=2615206 RepID=UPI0006F910FB|nr:MULTISPECIES: PDR/VanB family oxidoreductase [unclassified Aureimonas]KQT64385.1 oxygenase [Aureimonas sp. Leaf427]KQT81577.1 oxygenase [Aureimonas sp. Leaf460]
MRMNMEWRHAVVRTAEEVAVGVRLVEFDVEGPLAPFDPGSHTHIAVTIDGARAIRTYTCVPAPANRIAIAVKLHPNSRGGSRFVWSLKPGSTVELTVPENRFELSWRADRYLLIAGGIGVTPIYGMAQRLAAAGQDLRMIYGGVSRAVMPFVDELGGLLGERIELFPADEGRSFDLAAEIAALPKDGEAYVCGPLGLLEAVKTLWRVSGRPVSRLRYEVFGDNGRYAETSFEVSVLNRGVTITVPPDQSLLNALIGAGVEMIYDCQRGECGLCAVRIVETDSDVDHRDVFFDEDEKNENHRMCACVSRLTGGSAVIDIGYRTE